MAENKITERPELTLPPAEAERVKDAYGKAKVILEYGSGGSTVLGAEMENKRIFSVESARPWARMMQGWFSENPPAQGTEVDVIWCNVGKTKKWGFPRDNSEFLRYPRYALGVWGRENFVQPDVVLVDGRFRPGCAMATALMTKKTVTLLVDDYSNRRRYHAIETYLGSPKLHGRMAEFKVKPQTLEPKNLLEITGMMIRP